MQRRVAHCCALSTLRASLTPYRSSDRSVTVICACGKWLTGEMGRDKNAASLNGELHMKTKRLYLYRLSQDSVTGYDVYTDCVVAAHSVDAAKSVHPSGRLLTELHHSCSDWPNAKYPDAITVELIGNAAPHIKPLEIICASFHAG